MSKTSRSYSGGTPKVGVHEYYDGQIPFIRSGEIASKSTELTISETGLNNSSAKLVSKGDILYALYGATSGEVSLSKINGAINQAILAIKPIDGYENYFLMTWLQKEKEQITRTYLQGGQGNLSAKIVMNLVVNIPSLSEQSQIAQIFSKLDKTITLHEEKHRQLERLKKALLQKMFADETGYPALRFKGFTEKWEQRKLGETVVNIVAGGDINKAELLSKGKYPVYANALTNNGIVGYYASQYRIAAPAVTVTGRG